MTDGQSPEESGTSGSSQRLLLGSSHLIPRVADGMHARVRVGTSDEVIASSLREQGVEVEALDPMDPSLLADLDVDIVFVLQDAQSEAVETARAASQAFPEAYVLAYKGWDALEDESALEGLVDRIVDPGTAIVRQILPRLGNGYHREIWDVLEGIDHLAVLTHDNPDPDAIASGVALARLADAADCDAEVCYYGDISHQENQAFVNVLDLDLRRLDEDEDLTAFDGFALVDHARAGINNGLAPDTPIDIVIDHHPPRGPIEATYVDLQTEVGATSTLLVEYLDSFGVDIDVDVATALLFGIHVDTNAFTRGVSTQDFEAAATLVRTADLDALERIESPSINIRTLEAIGSAITNRRVEGSVLFTYIDSLPERDALAQAADQLLSLEGISTTVVYGMLDGTVYISARSRADGLDIGEALREAFAQVGTAGGHVDMAGAQLDMGVLDEVEDETSLGEVVESVVADRLLEVLEASPPTPPAIEHPPDVLHGRYGESIERDDDRQSDGTQNHGSTISTESEQE